MKSQESRLARRQFLEWVGASALASVALPGCRFVSRSDHLAAVQNVRQLERWAERHLGHDAFAYLAGGADDQRTVAANSSAFAEISIRPRRLVDVREIDTTVELFGDRYPSPLFLAPVGFQGLFHEQGELATARGASRTGHGTIVSSVSSFSIGEIANECGVSPWFQLYPTTNREVTEGLLRRAEAAGCPVVVLTVDTPVIGNREMHSTTLRRLLAGGSLRMGNYEGLRNGESINDPSMTWDMVHWLAASTDMKIVLKGIVTREDAELSVRHGAHGILVSNHGGRQLEIDRSTIECLPEVVEGAQGRIPVLLDGGIRRGTDIFKALAWGAQGVCIGRPYCWGLAAFGADGVARALELLQRELVLTMQLAGATSLGEIQSSHVLPASPG